MVITEIDYNISLMALSSQWILARPRRRSVRQPQAVQHTLGSFWVSLWCGHRLVLLFCDVLEGGVW